MMPRSPTNIFSGPVARAPHGALSREASMLQAAGRDGDTILAHINPAEARMLRQAGGRGTINPETGLPEFAPERAHLVGPGGVTYDVAVGSDAYNEIMARGAVPQGSPEASAPQFTHAGHYAPGAQGSIDAAAKGYNNPLTNGQAFDAQTLAANGMTMADYNATPYRAGSPDIGRVQPQQFTVREGSEFIDNYMNPYTDQVVNAFETDWDRALKMAQNSNNALATSKGAFGGSGHGVGSSLTNERAMDQYGRTVAGMRSGAFDKAVGAGLTDAGAYNSMEALSKNMALQGASLMPQIAAGNANLFNNDLSNLFSIGGAQQQLGQSGLDLAYSDFLKQWQYPMDMLGWATGLAGGVPTAANTTGEVPVNTGDKLGGAGSLMTGGAALAGKCWVAREVYGADNPKWMAFRDWLTTAAPRWLDRLYTRHGEAFARYIADKPGIKAVIRWAMDKVVR